MEFDTDEVDDATLQETITRLKKVILDENCKRMNKGTIKGFYGELVIKQLLEQVGFDVKHVGNQAGYDLEIKDVAKIDVKMSLPKDEFKWGENYWGWALVHSNKKREPSATHFVCLGCDDELTPKLAIIIPKERADSCPKGIRQFKKVKRCLLIFSGNVPTVSKDEDKELIDECQSAMKDNSIKTLWLERDHMDKHLFS